MLKASRRLLTAGARDPYNCVVLIPSYSAANSADLTFLAKSNIATTRGPTTCGSTLLKEYVSPFDATVVKLLKQAGLPMVGKTNLDEFGMGSSTTNSTHGNTLNPRYKDERIAGGSSGGSAAGVAGNLADVSLGTDTGGSVRQPASYCGIVGFKPTYGRISRYGVAPYAQSLDTVGILARTVDTVARVFGILDKYDEKDITSLPESFRDTIAARPAKSGTLTIGIPEELILAEIDKETMAQFEYVVDKLMDQGHSIQPVSIPSIGKLLFAYYTLATAEASSNLARFDGVRYGTSLDLGTGTERIAHTRTAGLGPEVQRRILLGTYTLSDESEDYYFNATRVRRQLVSEFNDVFAHPNVLLGTEGTHEGCDVLLSPTAFGRAPTLEEFKSDTKNNFLNEFVNDILTVPSSMAGLPAISVPCPNADFGVQVMGQHGDDRAVLAVAKLIEGF